MPASFQLLAAHPVLDFVNTLDGRFDDTGKTELLTNYLDLLAFLEQTQLVDPKQANGLRKKAGCPAAWKALHRALDLRELLASVFYGIAERGQPPEDALRRLGQYIAEGQQHRALAWKDARSNDGEGFRAEWTWGRFEAQLDLPVWAIAHSACSLLISGQMQHVHSCASLTCRWLFLDISKNHSRRWCDMKICGNRSKARRFQARR